MSTAVQYNTFKSLPRLTTLLGGAAQNDSVLTLLLSPSGLLSKPWEDTQTPNPPPPSPHQRPAQAHGPPFAHAPHPCTHDSQSCEANLHLTHTTCVLEAGQQVPPRMDKFPWQLREPNLRDLPTALH